LKSARRQHRPGTAQQFLFAALWRRDPDADGSGNLAQLCRDLETSNQSDSSGLDGLMRRWRLDAFGTADEVGITNGSWRTPCWFRPPRSGTPDSIARPLQASKAPAPEPRQPDQKLG
jgi:hypothetical protein